MGSGIYYPAVGGDDGWSAPLSGFSSGANFQVLGDWGAENFNDFIRFANVTVPQGVTIIEAYVTFTAYATLSGATCNVNCYFNDIDDAVAPTNNVQFDALDLTDAVAWDAIPTWTNGSQYDTPSLVSIFQDIVDRGGWEDGNAVQLILKDNGSSDSAYRQPSTINFVSGAEKAELHVTWEAAETTSIIDVSTDIRTSEEVISDLLSSVIAGLESLSDLESEIRAGGTSLIDLKSDISADFLTNFADLSTEVTTKAQEIIDVLTEIKAGNQTLIDLNVDIEAKAQILTDLVTDIRAQYATFKNLNTAISAVRSKWWLSTEIIAGCAARWNFNTEWNPERFLNTEIVAKKPYEFSFKTQTDEGYAATTPAVEFKVAGYSFPLRTLFLDYVQVGGDVAEYPLQLWWSRGLTGKGTLKNAKIKAEYVNNSNEGGHEVVTLDWLSCKVEDGDYQTVNETAVTLGDIPCDSYMDVTLKVECRDCSLSRGLIFFKLIITGDWRESIYGDSIVYRDGSQYHVSELDDFQSIDFISRLYVVA